MGISILGSTPSPLRHPIVSFYKEAIKMAQASSDVTYASGLTTITDSLLIAKTLTISNPATLQFGYGMISYIFADVLVLEGSLRTARFLGGSNALSTGGYGAGNLIIFARQITSIGVVEANGGNGTTPSSLGTVNGASAPDSPRYLGTGYSGFGGGSSYTVSSAGGGGDSYATYSGFASGSDKLPYIFPDFIPSVPPRSGITNGAGGSGSGSTSGGWYGNGGGGGGSVVAEGGDGGAGLSGAGAGGAGGGAGGYVFIMSENAIPAITINAYGGNGGYGYTSPAGGGGGGAGGLVSIIAPSSSAIVSVLGGTGGNGGGTGGAGQSGASGQNIFTADNFS